MECEDTTQYNHVNTSLWEKDDDSEEDDDEGGEEGPEEYMGDHTLLYEPNNSGMCSPLNGNVLSGMCAGQAIGDQRGINFLKEPLVTQVWRKDWWDDKIKPTNTSKKDIQQLLRT